MSLDPSYLEYPERRRGYDHELYAWSALKDRSPLTWPGGAAVAVWIVVSLEWFPITPSDRPFRAPGHMQTPYPDFRHYTARDYGNRVGVYRLLEAFAKVGTRASFATNAAVAERYPRLMNEIIAAGHEIVAHSTDMNGTIATGLAETDERALIVGALDRLEQATGVRPRGWLSIARSQTLATPRLLREAGLAYACDWVNDELPYRFKSGLVNIPLNHELSDRQVIGLQQQSMESYAEQVRDACDWLCGESAAQGGARMLPLHLTTYITGLPYRMDAFEGLMSDLASRQDATFLTGAALCDAFLAQTV